MAFAPLVRDHYHIQYACMQICITCEYIEAGSEYTIAATTQEARESPNHKADRSRGVRFMLESRFTASKRGPNSSVGSVLGSLSCVIQRRRFDHPLSLR